MDTNIVYVIVCQGNTKIYVGSAIKFSKRRLAHLSMLRGGKHNNRHLQNAYNMYGEDSFTFFILEKCNDTNLIEIEQLWIDSFLFEDLMNSSPTATNTKGFKHSYETKKYLSSIHTGKEPEHLKKYYFKKGHKPLFKGKKHTVETKNKMRESTIRSGINGITPG